MIAHNGIVSVPAAL